MKTTAFDIPGAPFEKRNKNKHHYATGKQHDVRLQTSCECSIAMLLGEQRADMLNIDSDIEFHAVSMLAQLVFVCYVCLFFSWTLGLSDSV